MRRHSPNCQPRDVTKIDSLVVPRLEHTKYTAFSMFIQDDKYKPPSVMDKDGKSDIGAWNREAKLRFDALPKEELATLQQLADKRTEDERKAAEVDPEGRRQAR